jgi:hypothetical protein
MKKLSTFVAALLLAAITPVPPASADRPYTLCDPARSSLCQGLSLLYEFNETASDTARTSETGPLPLIEIGRTDASQDTSIKRLGAASFNSGTAGLYLSRMLPFASSINGPFTMGFWLYVVTPPSADGKAVPVVWMAPIASSSEFVLNGSAAPAYPRVSLYRIGSSTYVRYEVKQSLNDTPSYVQSASALSSSTWYYVALGQIRTPTTTEPYQHTLWMEIDGGTRQTQTITYPDTGDVGHFMLAGLPQVFGQWEAGAWKMDQLGLWNRSLSPAEVDRLVNAGGGRAYPFY